MAFTFSNVSDFTQDFESAVASVLQGTLVPGTLVQDTSVSDGLTTYLAAVSGGADSSAMLAALAAVRDRAEGPAFALHCVHVEHGIRPAEETRGDAAFVRELCEKLNVSCRVVSVTPGKIARTAKRTGMGIEAAARLYRSRALFQEARRLGAACILTAHTRSDLLETTLMRILRGSGPAGLAAMPVSRGRFVRPLLALNRAQVIRYLTEKGLRWREDSSNSDTRFLRNLVRIRLIPQLDELFPHWESGIAALAETQSLAAGFIGDEAHRKISWSDSGEGRLCTGEEHFFAQSQIIREEAVFQGIDKLLTGTNSPGPRRATVRRFCEGLTAAADLGPLTILRENGSVILSTEKKDACEHGFSLLIKEPGLYTLIYARKKVFVEVKPCSSGEAGSGGYALPLLVRRTFKGDCAVESAGGLNGDSRTLFTVTVLHDNAGGRDVQ